MKIPTKTFELRNRTAKVRVGKMKTTSDATANRMGKAQGEPEPVFKNCSKDWRPSFFGASFFGAGEGIASLVHGRKRCSGMVWGFEKKQQ